VPTHNSTIRGGSGQAVAVAATAAPRNAAADATWRPEMNYRRFRVSTARRCCTCWDGWRARAVVPTQPQPWCWDLQKFDIFGWGGGWCVC